MNIQLGFVSFLPKHQFVPRICTDNCDRRITLGLMKSRQDESANLEGLELLMEGGVLAFQEWRGKDNKKENGTSRSFVSLSVCVLRKNGWE